MSKSKLFNFLTAGYSSLRLFAFYLNVLSGVFERTKTVISSCTKASLATNNGHKTSTKKLPSPMRRESLGISGHPGITKTLNTTLSDSLLRCIHYHALTSSQVIYIILLTIPTLTFTCPKLSLFLHSLCCNFISWGNRCVYTIESLALRITFLFFSMLIA